MAREIKAIECPKCGSTQKVEIKSDYYKCVNCNTEYFIDNDDVTITHNVNYNTPKNDFTTTKKPLLIFGVSALIVFVGIMLSLTLAGGSGNSVLQEATIAEQTEYSWERSDAVSFTDGDGNPILLRFGQLNVIKGDDKSKSGRYAVFTDMLSGKELKKQFVKEIPDANTDEFKLQTFVNGDVYAIANAAYLFKLDKNDMSMRPENSLAKEHPELSAGVADFEFINQHYGNGIKLLTNDGKGYTYFPIANVVYDKEQVRNAERAMTLRDPNAKTRTYFDFSRQSDDLPEKKIQLYKWVQKDNLGGPNEWPYFEWNTYYNGNRLEERAIRGTGDIVISYEDFTPDRLYFSPKILYFDNDYVLFSMNKTAGPNAKTSLQCLNAKTGTIVFTLPFDEQYYFLENASRYKNGFVAFTPGYAMVIGMDGELIKKIEML